MSQTRGLAVPLWLGEVPPMALQQVQGVLVTPCLRHVAWQCRCGWERCLPWHYSRSRAS
jgi:hypothetical protein